MTRSLDAFSRARIVVVGDVMLDRYWQGRAVRISPEAPVPIVRVTAEDERPGGAKCRSFAVETRCIEGARFSSTVKLRVLAQRSAKSRKHARAASVWR